MLVLMGFYIPAKKHETRLFLLTVASLFFYLWGGVFDFLIFIFVVVVTFASVWLASKCPRRKGFFISVGICTLTGHLFIWKYYSSLYELISSIYPQIPSSLSFDPPLPLGISFFTFQGLAYLIDFYKNLTGALSFKEFLLYKSFFPQLLAGPIVRPHELVPQIQNLKRPTLQDLQEGLIIFAIGLFKKIIIADRIFPFVDNILNSSKSFDRTSLLMASGGIFILVWADFGGFTDMGRGCARMLGIHLPKNFLSPLFSKRPSEFWLRWHVSLGKWIKQYIYEPLSKKKSAFLNPFTAILATFLFSGLWHGAKFTYVCSFLSFAFFILIEYVLVYLHISKFFKSLIPEIVFRVLTNFLTITLMCIFSGTFFQIRSLDSAVQYFKCLFLNPGIVHATPDIFAQSFLFMLILEIIFYYNLEKSTSPNIEALKAWTQKIQDQSPKKYQLLQISLGFFVGVSIIVCIALRREGGPTGFIYFQF